jgi:hypothetical protein
VDAGGTRSEKSEVRSLKSGRAKDVQNASSGATGDDAHVTAADVVARARHRRAAVGAAAGSFADVARSSQKALATTLDQLQVKDPEKADLLAVIDSLKGDMIQKPKPPTAGRGRGGF